MKSLVAVVPFAAILLLASACGGGGQPGTTPAPTATNAPTEVLTATPSPSVRPEAQAQGKIAFGSIGGIRGTGIYLINADGTAMSLLISTDDVAAAPAFSPDGTRIAFLLEGVGGPEIERFLVSEVYIANADGSDLINLSNSPPSFDAEPAWSPDGKLIAFASDRDDLDRNWSIFVINADGSGLTKLTDDSTSDRKPAWSPDGTRIAFGSRRDGLEDIYVMNADGSGIVRLTDDPEIDRSPSWSPDGSRISFQSVRDGDWEIYVMNADGSDQVRLTKSRFGDEDPAWSPDGTRIAFMSERDEDREIYIMDADGSNQTNLTNSPDNIDITPAWSPVP